MKILTPGIAACAAFATSSLPGPTTTAARSSPLSVTAARTCPSIERPATRCSTFGRLDFIRVPSPAARTTATPDTGMKIAPIDAPSIRADPSGFEPLSFAQVIAPSWRANQRNGLVWTDEREDPPFARSKAGAAPRQGPRALWDRVSCPWPRLCERPRDGLHSGTTGGERPDCGVGDIVPPARNRGIAGRCAPPDRQAAGRAG